MLTCRDFQGAARNCLSDTTVDVDGEEITIWYGTGSGYTYDSSEDYGREVGPISGLGFGYGTGISYGFNRYWDSKSGKTYAYGNSDGFGFEQGSGRGCGYANGSGFECGSEEVLFEPDDDSDL